MGDTPFERPFSLTLGPRPYGVIEDDYHQAREVPQALETQGIHVVGPYPTVHEGLEAARGVMLDAAVLDIENSAGMTSGSYPVANTKGIFALPAPPPRGNLRDR